MKVSATSCPCTTMIEQVLVSHNPVTLNEIQGHSNRYQNVEVSCVHHHTKCEQNPFIDAQTQVNSAVYALLESTAVGMEVIPPFNLSHALWAKAYLGRGQGQTYEINLTLRKLFLLGVRYLWEFNAQPSVVISKWFFVKECTNYRININI